MSGRVERKDRPAHLRGDVVKEGEQRNEKDRREHGHGPLRKLLPAGGLHNRALGAGDGGVHMPHISLELTIPRANLPVERGIEVLCATRNSACSYG